MLNIIGIFIILFLFTTLFIFIGRSLFIIPSTKNEVTTPLVISSSYFLGMAFFLSIWRTFSFITDNALISLLVTILCSILIIYFFGRQFFKSFFIEFLGLIKSKWFIIISVLIFIFVCLYWIGSFKELTPITLIGSLHSPRYANFSTYILEFNRIPVLGQNYGQSMLAAIPMIFGLNSPLLALCFWLSITLINFALLIYSMFIYIKFTIKFSILATFLLLFGNTAISVFHILTIDSGSPFILNGYSDSIASIGTFIVILFFIKNALFNTVLSSQISLKEIILFFSISIFWHMSAPQNFIFFGVLIILSLIVASKNNRQTLFKIFKISMFFLIFSSIGIVEGGMFTPSALKEKIVLPGIMEIKDKGIAINPGIPFHVGLGGHWEFGNKSLISQSVEIKKKIELPPNLIVATSALAIIEQFITNSFKVIFWPFFGILGLFILIKLNIQKKGSLLSNKIALDYNNIFFVTFFIFSIGLLINSFVSISGYKWELSRFLILGYFLGMFSLIICFNFLFQNNILSKLCLYVLTILITIGPVANSVLIIFVNIFDNKNSISFFEKMNLLINTSGMIR